MEPPIPFNIADHQSSYIQCIIPSEVLFDIIRLLQPVDRFRLRLTCRRLYEIVNDPAVWCHTSFDVDHTPSREAFDATLSFCSPSVRRLEINMRHKDFGRFPWSYFTKCIAKCAPSLVRFSLLGLRRSSEPLYKALSTCSKLSHLTLNIGFSYDVPKLPSLKSFEGRVPLNISAYDIQSALDGWHKNDFSPDQFIITGCVNTTLISAVKSVDIFNRRNTPFNLPPSSVKIFQVIEICCFESALHVFSWCPVLEVVLEGSQCFVPVTYCSGITKSPLILVQSTPQCASKISTSEPLPAVCKVTPFPNIAGTLSHLVLKECRDVTSDSLDEIALLCHGLNYLNLDSCNSALEDLRGLTSISKHCTRLEGLNLTNIHCVSDKTGFWDVLSSFKKLSYLAVEFCTLPVDFNFPLRQLKTLVSMQIGYIHFSGINCVACRVICDQSLVVLSRLMTANLKVLWMREQPGARFAISCGLKHLLLSVPNLQHFCLSTCGTFQLPSDSRCYQSMEKIDLQCYGCTIYREFADALVQNRRLTHCIFVVKSITTDAIGKLIEATRLISCLIYFQSPPTSQKSWKSKVKKAAKVRGVPEFIVEQYPSLKNHAYALKPLQGIN